MSYRIRRRYWLANRRIYVFTIKCDKCDQVVAVLRSPAPTPKASPAWRRQYKKRRAHAACKAVQ